MEIEGKVFIVTGGASGLGAGTARMLAAHGARVVVADLQIAQGSAVAQETGGTFVRCDVSSEVDGQTAVDQATSMGKLVGLINCAGIAPAEKTLGKNGPHNLDLYTKTIMVNLVGSFNMIRLAATAMSKNEPEATGERGVLISTASVAAYDGQIGQAAYAASKGGVVGMTLPIARDLARNGIRNMTIAPGIFATPMLLGMPQEVQDALGMVFKTRGVRAVVFAGCGARREIQGQPGRLDRFRNAAPGPQKHGPAGFGPKRASDAPAGLRVPSGTRRARQARQPFRFGLERAWREF